MMHHLSRPKTSKPRLESDSEQEKLSTLTKPHFGMSPHPSETSPTGEEIFSGSSIPCGPPSEEPGSTKGLGDSEIIDSTRNAGSGQSISSNHAANPSQAVNLIDGSSSDQTLASICTINDGKGTYQPINARMLMPTNAVLGARLWKTWWMEMTSCILSVCAFIAIIATVLPYEGQPLPNWPYKLSINTLISVYTIILRASVLFVAGQGVTQLKWSWFEQEAPLKDLQTYDDASRGPWGSIILLLRPTYRQIASPLGALITIAVLIIGPFVQQVVDTHECVIAAKGGIATISRTNIFERDRRPNRSGGYRVSPELQNALDAGILNPGRPVNFQCSTSNCNFLQEYSTVGFCSRCVDKTSSLSVDLTTGPDNIPQTNVYMPEDLFANLSQEDTDPQSLAVFVRSDSLDIHMLATYIQSEKSTSCSDVCPSLGVDTIKECMANTDTLRFGCTTLPPCFSCGEVEATEPITGSVGAATCTLYPCLRTYTARVDRGHLLENLVSTSSLWDPNSLYLAQADIGCLNSTETEMLKKFGYNITDKAWLQLNHSSSNPQSGEPDIVSSEVISPQCYYELIYDMISEVSACLINSVSGNISVGMRQEDGIASPVLQAIYSEGNITLQRIDEAFRNISDAITWYIQQNGLSDYSEPALGQAWETQICVAIQWPFLIYPGVLVLMVLIFFSLMLFETRRHEISRHDWKASQLALLFHGLDERLIEQRGLSFLTKADEMMKAADQIPVRLAQTDSGWRLIGSRSDTGAE